ncbi:MAG: hypothetical protein KDB27_16905 [Planctomycetales bacterium]|nr:hypothetical protein [Planctomycetales bacterium]
MDWLRVQLLRLRSMDWGNGLRTIHQLQDGVAKFSSHYPVKNLAVQLNVDEDDILAFIDSPPALKEIEAKSFTLSWTDDNLSLTWLEEGILDWKTEISHDYYEDDGKYFVKCRFVQRIIYLDGSDRVVNDSGTNGSAQITKQQYLDARRNFEKQSE